MNNSLKSKIGFFALQNLPNIVEYKGHDYMLDNELKPLIRYYPFDHSSQENITNNIKVITQY